MRILHVADYYMPSMGYQENLLPRWHLQHGHEVHVLTSDRYANVPDYEQTWGPLLGRRHVGPGIEDVDGVTVRRLSSIAERRSRILLRGMASAIREVNPDVVFGHGTTNFTAYQLAYITRRLGMPLFLDCHMLFTVQDESFLGRLFYRAVRASTRRFLAPATTTFYGVAAEACDFLRSAQGVPEAKVRLLPLGLDTDRFHPAPEAARDLREAMGMSSDDIIVMQTGKLTRDKGPDLLARAMAPLMVADRRLRLVFVGGGSSDYLHEVRAPLIEHEVIDRVTFLPFVRSQELAGYYSAADVVVFPAASSLSSIEAAGCARAVVMTDLPAGKWRAERGIGMVFADGDAGELNEVLRDLVDDESKRVRSGMQAREAVIKYFSYDRVAQELERDMFRAIHERSPSN